MGFYMAGTYFYIYVKLPTLNFEEGLQRIGYVSQSTVNSKQAWEKYFCQILILSVG